MKILVVSQYFWPENFRVNDLVVGLKDRGHEVTVLTGQPNYPDGEIFKEFKEDANKFSAYFGINVFRVPLWPRKSGSGFNLIMNFISFMFTAMIIGSFKLRGREFDKIFVFGNSPLTVMLPAIFIGWLKRAPVCVWVMDLWPDTLIALGVISKGWQERIASKFMSFLYNSCDLILGQSNEFVVSLKEMTKTPVGMLPSWSDVTAESAIFELPSDGKLRICFAGNVGDAQDFPTLIAAANVLKASNSQAKFYIVGDGRGVNNLKIGITKNGLEDQIILLGRHPIERMASLFSQADILYLALKNDPVFDKTIPGKLQSYMAAGKPILAMLGGAGKAVVEASNSGVIVMPGDYEALAKTVMVFEKMDESERIEMGENGLKYYTENFDRDLVINRLAAYLASIKDR